MLALIRKYPEVDGNTISRELAINLERITKAAKELQQRNLIGIVYVFAKEFRYELSYAPSRFYPMY